MLRETNAQSAYNILRHSLRIRPIQTSNFFGFNTTIDSGEDFSTASVLYVLWQAAQAQLVPCCLPAGNARYSVLLAVQLLKPSGLVRHA